MNNLGFELGAAPDEAAALDILRGAETATLAGQKAAILALAQARGWASPEWENITQDAIGRVQSGSAQGAAGTIGGSFKIKRLGLGEPRAPQWILKGIIPTESVVVIFGESGAGKSFLALDLAFCVATGRVFGEGEI
jgi:hypothetical protein